VRRLILLPLQSQLSGLTIFMTSLLALFMPWIVWAQTPSFETTAPHVLILDHNTGLVLFEKDARAPVAPASMTKIMTAELIFERLKDGRLSLDTEFTVSEEAWRRGGIKSGSSTMFLNLGSTVRVEDLLRGVIIQSGNDACIVLAEGIAGSETAFAELMTSRARELGLSSATFRNSTGWPHPEHRISTYDLAVLAKRSIDVHPEFYPLYAERNFTWNDITQNNRNPLLTKFTGADGLKTGHTEVSGYGLVASAQRGETRRIVVVNGLGSKAQRSQESLRLMQAAFDQFKIYNLYNQGDIVGHVPVYMGKSETVNVQVDTDVKTGLFRAARKGLKTQLKYDGMPTAPITKGDKIADLLILEPGKDQRVIALYASEDIAAKSAFSKAWTALLRIVRG